MVLSSLLGCSRSSLRSSGSIWISSTWYISKLWLCNSFDLPLHRGTDSIMLCTVCRTRRFLYFVGGYMSLIYCSLVVGCLRLLQAWFKSFLCWNPATIGRALDFVYFGSFVIVSSNTLVLIHDRQGSVGGIHTYYLIIFILSINSLMRHKISRIVGSHLIKTTCIQ